MPWPLRSLVWKHLRRSRAGKHQRRCLLYRYAPAHLALGGSVAEYGEGELEGLSELGRALLEPPGYEPATNSRAGRANIRTLLRKQLEA